MNYEFKYETHSHTKEGSACAVWSAKESVNEHKKAGYTGLIITNHFFYGNTSVDRSLPWADWVRRFCSGYNYAKDEGDKIGLQVFFGWEAGYNGTEFLIYGLDEDWLLSHPEIKDATVAEQYKLVHDSNGLVVHAHPFREESYIPEIRLYPKLVDAVEGYNATHNSKFSKFHNDPLFNTRAIKFAKENHLPITSGSDTHKLPMLEGGMLFDHKLKNINEFIVYVRKGEGYKLLTSDQNPSVTPTEAFKSIE